MKTRRKLTLYMHRLVANLFEGSFSSLINATRGIEFDEIRQYQPGDDFRAIDWKTTTRTGKMHIRVKLADKRAIVLFLIDRSASKIFGTSLITKENMQSFVLKLLAHAVAESGNQAGFITFTDGIESYYPPRCGEKDVFKTMEILRSQKMKSRLTDLDQAFRFVNGLKMPSSLIIILSDFLAPHNYEASFKAMNQKHDILPIIISDKREKEIPKKKGYVALRDLETGSLTFHDLSKSINKIHYFLELLRKLQIDYMSIQTDGNMEQWVNEIAEFLDMKQKKRKRIRLN